MKELFTKLEDAETLMKSLAEESKYVISIRQLPTEEYLLEWQEHKNYTAHDGQVFPDEVWFTEDQQMLLVQDISHEHCRNILRMMLRQEREARDRMNQLTDYVSHIMEEALSNLPTEDNLDDGAGSSKVLH